MLVLAILTTVVLPVCVTYQELFPQQRTYSCVFKSQRWMIRLKAYEYCGYLGTWVKRSLDQLQISMENLHTRLSRQRQYRSRTVYRPPKHRRKLNMCRTICIAISMPAAGSKKPLSTPTQTTSRSTTALPRASHQ